MIKIAGVEFRAPTETLCFAACQFNEKNIFHIREDFSQKASLDD